MDLTKRKRTAFFWIFFGLFLIIGLFLIAYVNNIKIDFQHKRIIQTGGIFLKVTPKKDINVYLDNQKQDIGPLAVFQRLFFDNLFPKKYSLKVEKDGYFSWQKNLDVKEGIVTAASHIILLPKNIEKFSKKYKLNSFKYSWFLNKNYLFLAEETTSSFKAFIYNVESASTTPLIKIKKKPTTEILKPGLNKDNLIFFKIKDRSFKKYYLIDISNISKNKISAYLLPEAIPDKPKGKLIDINFSPNKKFLILAYQNSIYRYNPKTKTKELLLKTNNLKKVFINHSNIFFIDDNGLTMLSSLLNKPKIIISKKAFKELSSSTNIIFSNETKNLAFLNNYCLYVYNTGKNKFFPYQKLSLATSPKPMVCNKKIEQIFFSPDGKKIVATLKDKIIIFYLVDYFLDYIHKAGEYDVLPVSASKIEWYKDFNHLLIKDKSNNFLFAEIDTRDNTNIYKLDKSIKNFFYDIKKNTLFILKKGYLFRIELEKYL